MNSTLANETINADLMSLIPEGTRHIVDIGGAHADLARAYCEMSPDTVVSGLDAESKGDAEALNSAGAVANGGIETMSEEQLAALASGDCWVLGNNIEKMRDPWATMKRLRAVVEPGASVLVCVPNAQHWSVQWQLISGNFRYDERQTLNERSTHLFTRTTLIELFAQTGWEVEDGLTRQLTTPEQKQYLEAVRQFAQTTGLDADLAVQDATPYQYLFRLKPAAMP